MDFHGRREELDALERGYRSARGSFVPIYGRRRVGKTALIVEFLQGKSGIYYCGKQLPKELLIKDFLCVAGEQIGQPLLAQVSVDNWRDALEGLLRLWNTPKRRVLALDEFQWMCESSPELPGLLQEYWDLAWQHDNRMMVIVCGSYIGFMLREFLGRKAPLFGRRTAQIHLQPFGFREAAAFHPSYSREEQARTYFICGGVPQYLLEFRRKRSVEQNIVASLLERSAPLSLEADFLLREELRDVEKYHGILMALATCRKSQVELGRVVGLGHNVQYHLKQLAGLGYIRRVYPLSGRRARKHEVRYELADPLLRFWFRFVYPNQSLIASMGAKHVLQSKIRPQRDAYFGSCFERMCREVLPLLHRKENISGPIQVGEFFSKETQIDLVGVRQDGWIDLGECKWGSVRSPSRAAQELERKIPLFPNPKNHAIARRIFARRSPKRIPEGVKWHSLESLYKLPGPESALGPA